MGLKRWFSCGTVKQLHQPTDSDPFPAVASGDLQRARELRRQLTNAENAWVVPRDASFLVNVLCDRQATPLPHHYHHQQQPDGALLHSPPSFRRLSSIPKRAGSAPTAAGPKQPQPQQQSPFFVPTFATSPQSQQQPHIIAQQPAGTAMVGGRPVAVAWTDSRRQLESNLAAEQALMQQQAEPDFLSEQSRLQQRLARLNLAVLDAAADGNCQFRAVSQQLYGSQQHHGFVRQRAVEHIKRHPGEFSAFLGEDFASYVSGMGRDGCWGDELTLRAVCDSFGVVVHVVTSEQHNWYLQYQPRRLVCGLEVFLTYVAPLHYNSLRRQQTLGKLPSMTRRLKSA